jgi:hypothetical protein
LHSFISLFLDEEFLASPPPLGDELEPAKFKLSTNQLGTALNPDMLFDNVRDVREPPYFQT